MKFVSEFDVPALDIPIPNPDQFMDFRYQQSRFFSSVAAWKEKEMTLMLLDPIIGGYGRSRLSPDLPLLINSVNMAAFHGVNLFTSYLPFDARKGKGDTGHEEKATGYTAEEFNFLNEYTGRITQVLRGAKRDAGVALYYPINMFQADLLASNEGWPEINTLHLDKQEAWDATELTLINGDVRSIAGSLKKRGFQNLYIDGGKVIRSFLKEGLIDELIITKIPIILGKGIPLFGEIDGRIELEHIETEIFANGLVKDHYKIRK